MKSGLRLTGDEIETLPVFRAGLDLAGEQVEFHRLPVRLWTQSKELKFYSAGGGSQNRRNRETVQEIPGAS